jgi:hypothetical protein
VKRHIFDVEYLDDPTDPALAPRTYRTRVVSVDKYKTERDGHQYGVLDAREQPQAVGFLWLWHSSIRERHIDEATTFEEFLDRCLDNVAAEDEPVDPTREGALYVLPSTSQDTSPESATPSGSTPTTV